MKYVVIIERGPNNCAAYVPDLPGCVSTGETVEETVRNIREAVRGHLEVMRQHGEPLPQPTTVATQVEVPAPGAEGVDLSRFAGLILLTEDPLQYQLRVRGEWS